MNTMLSWLDTTDAYLDDIVISGRMKTKYNENLYKVIQCIQEYELHVKVEKYEFSLSQITYLGFFLDKDGIRLKNLRNILYSGLLLSHYKQELTNIVAEDAPWYDLRASILHNFFFYFSIR